MCIDIFGNKYDAKIGTPRIIFVLRSMIFDKHFEKFVTTSMFIHLDIQVLVCAHKCVLSPLR